jgi:hypothetical protein
LYRPDGRIFDVSISGQDPEHEVVEYAYIEGRRGPSADSEILLVSPTAQIRPVGEPKGGFLPVEILDESRVPLSLFIPVAEKGEGVV